VVDNAMDFSACDPAGLATTPVAAPPPYCNAAGILLTQCNAGNLTSCTPPNLALRGTIDKGVIVMNAAGAIIMDPRGSSGAGTDSSTGAAYVVVSHGPEGGGAYSAEGALMTSAVAAGTMEAKNAASLPYLPPAMSAPAASITSFLVDDVYNGLVTTHFDDIVSRPNILTLATRAQLGPRAR
jgi:hypothetical protein